MKRKNCNLLYNKILSSTIIYANIYCKYRKITPYMQVSPPYFIHL